MQEPAQSAQEAERTSRQDLVIAPRHSSLPMLLGAVLCAGTGFGMVWALGIGRSTGGGETAPPAQTAMPMPPSGEPSVAFMPEEPAPPAADDALSMSQSDLQSGEPRRFPAATSEADAPRAMNERGWRQPTAPAASPPVIDRYPTRPATLESPESSAMPPAQDGRSSRFAAPGRFPGTGDEPVRLTSAESAAIESQPTADQADSPPPADAEPVTDALPPAEKPADPGDAPLPGTLTAEPRRSSTDLLAPAPSDMTDPADAALPLPAPSPPPLSSAAAKHDGGARHRSAWVHLPRHCPPRELSIGGGSSGCSSHPGIIPSSRDQRRCNQPIRKCASDGPASKAASSGAGRRSRPVRGNRSHRPRNCRRWIRSGSSRTGPPRTDAARRSADTATGRGKTWASRDSSRQAGPLRNPRSERR
jgi:hypothetical protein